MRMFQKQNLYSLYVVNVLIAKHSKIRRLPFSDTDWKPQGTWKMNFLCFVEGFPLIQDDNKRMVSSFKLIMSLQGCSSKKQICNLIYTWCAMLLKRLLTSVEYILPKTGLKTIAGKTACLTFSSLKAWNGEPRLSNPFRKRTSVILFQLSLLAVHRYMMYDCLISYANV